MLISKPTIMRIKNKIYASAIVAASLMAGGCDSQLDIVPNGKTTFTTVEELESLLNQQWRIHDWETDFNILCGQILPANIEDTYNVSNSIEHAIMFGDESVNRADLTEEDSRYSFTYGHIYYMNVVISKAPDMQGDEQKKKQIAAEAKVLRAWLHFLMVNFYAAQYDPATADHTGGIAYVDNTNSGEQKTKLTVAQVYEKILADCTDDIIKDLKQKIDNDPCRFEADFGYAVRARVLFQMKRYDEALEYARKAIALNGAIASRSGILQSGTWEKAFDEKDVYLFINSSNVVNSGVLSLVGAFSPDILSCFEEGDYLRDHTDAWEWYDESDMNTGIDGAMQYSGSSYRLNTYGIDAEQMYYVAGESLILTGKIDEGLEMIDRVRANRIDAEHYRPFKGSVSTEKEAMELLIKAKRVEFLVNYEYFFDCKRRNTMAGYARDIIHDCGKYGKFTIKPNSPLWIYPFPLDATTYNSSLTQNC